MNYKTLRWIIMGHVIFAGFFLPVAVTFAITGGLYTFGIVGSYETHTVTQNLALEADPGLEQLTTVAREILQTEFKAGEPSGSAKLNRVGTSWAFNWSGVRAEFSMEPTLTPNEFKVSYKRTSPHRFFVQLHKAKGGWPFKVLAGALAIGFLSLFLSGAILAGSNPQRSRWFVYSLVSGFGVFAFAAAFS